MVGKQLLTRLGGDEDDPVASDKDHWHLPLHLLRAGQSERRLALWRRFVNETYFLGVSEDHVEVRIVGVQFPCQRAVAATLHFDHFGQRQPDEVQRFL